jgi:hypothetical protein
MVLRPNIGKEYSEQLSHWDKGHALYTAPSSKDLKIGHCGYFSNLGEWNPIALLTDTEDVLAQGLEPMKTTARPTGGKKDEVIEWGPMNSSNVIKRELKMDAGIALVSYFTYGGKFSPNHDQGFLLRVYQSMLHFNST